LEAAPSTPTPRAAEKPHAKVSDVKAATAGAYQDYYVILDATVKNEGADGSLLVLASVTQDGAARTQQTSLFLRKDGSQVVRFVFPIKWEGGEWTPVVTVKAP
jgi:hypothetical protein